MGDKKLAKFVVRSHQKHHPNNPLKETEEDEEENEDSAIKPIPQELLKKYIVYARQSRNPSLSSINQDKVSTLYGKIRQESMVGHSNFITENNKYNMKMLTNLIWFFLVVGYSKPSNHTSVC